MTGAGSDLGPITVNATILGERPTGLGIYALGLMNALADQGEDLIVVTSRPEAISARGARVERAPRAVRPEGGARGHLARLAWLQVALPPRLARSRSQLLLNVVPEGPLLSPIPQATIVHDVLPLLYPAEYPRSRSYFRHVLPVLLRRSRAILVDSERTRRDVLAGYPDVPPERVHVVFAGYDRERFIPQPREAGADPTPYVLYIGNIAPHKNLLRLVDGFAQVARRTPATLVIRGWGRPRHVSALRERIDALRLGDRIDWRPYESADALPRLYRGARGLILPSLYEGFGLTALEAMASGTPVIASSAASVPEVVGDAAYLVDPLDTSGLATAMLALLADDALAGELRERGLRRATLFSWERTAQAVRSHLRTMVPRR